ncbi:large ribosomal subunit protein bL34m [Tribolium castaneum]|uniref:Large ribosomal subunit protein bL34m n=1 Tax=Tribolium castaneum TaxID=7070 RepID=A0A139WDP6_TRICA|nr:PREDICTED: 39S ribosomal protein L34, mitochondrial [Tribolium castaneum]KYB26079.1 39S ribosomal protein L34, mitochondrial-like Protein [Tribolium castaneum]|eukprot:XP_008196141.1 PREDICTED: 39S ribosomal protein L34, mitochondrial [Tribolium castaneum]
MSFLLNSVPKFLQIQIGGLYETSIRTIMRNHFPRPNERRRILRHGWKKRMETPAGRRVLMNRILKGRWVYSH